MTQSDTTGDPAAIVRTLQGATNAHDLDAIVACFAPDYRNETPVHPARGFTGNDQVRRNWTQLLGAIPDLCAEVVALAVSGTTVWSEWEHRGTRPDGTGHLMRGVIVFTVDAGSSRRRGSSWNRWTSADQGSLRRCSNRFGREQRRDLPPGPGRRGYRQVRHAHRHWLDRQRGGRPGADPRPPASHEPDR